MIHTCPQRAWYVDEYLIPSLVEQGIKNIIVYNDVNGEGQLTSLMKSYEYTNDKDTWHLQDDVIISSRFKELTEIHNDGVVCGFCNGFSSAQPGKTNVFSMWYSMPCIRIPGHIFRNFVFWLDTLDTKRRYGNFIETGKHDDVLFQYFMQENYNREPILNLAPNIVNHIDHLIGGSILNKARDKELSFVMAKYWDEPDLVIDIEQRLKKGGHNNETD